MYEIRMDFFTNCLNYYYYFNDFYIKIFINNIINENKFYFINTLFKI